MSGTYFILSLLRRSRPGGSVGRSARGCQETGVRETSRFPKRQMFIGKPPEPVPSTSAHPFGGTPKLRNKI